MTPVDKQLALVSLDEAGAHLDAACTALAAARAAMEGPDEPVDPVDPPDEPPPLPDPLVPLGLVALPGPDVGTVVLAWQAQAAAERLSVALSWGAGKFLGRVVLPAGTTSHVVSGLAPQLHEFDVGYVQTSGVAGPLVRVTATPLAGEPEPPGSGEYPIGAPWRERRTWITERAGCKQSALRRIASQADLDAADLPGTWAGPATGGQWNCTGTPAAGLVGLDIKGLVYYTGKTSLVMEDCRAMGVRWANEALKSGGRISRVTIVRHPTLALGQGGLNFWGQANFVVDHCDISGFADGIQCSGNGVIRDTWVHDLAYGFSPEQGGATHNDGTQSYSGVVTVERCVYDMGGVANSTNGALFCSTPSASFKATELFVDVTVALANSLHAHQSPLGITVDGGRVSKLGRIIGKVSLSANVVRD